MRSLRRTALLWMTGLITGVGLTGAVIAYALALREANGFMDGQLRQIALNAGPSLRAQDGPGIHDDPEDDFVVQIWDATGMSLHAVPPGVDIPRVNGSGLTTLNALGARWRVFASGDGIRSIQVAQRMEVRQEIAESTALQAAAPILITIPIGWLVVGWAMGRVLADLRRLATEVESLPVESREPIDLARVPVEAAPLVVAMNRLIERLRATLTQQRKFLSDAAHELRTPLTALNLQIVNIANPARSIAPEDIVDLRNGARRAAALVDQLLRLARYDATADIQASIPLDLRTIVLAAVADHVALAESRSVDLGVTSSDTVPLVGDPRDLQILFGNLVDNAVKYTPAGGTVDVAITIGPESGCEVSISDTGPGIDPALLARVFDRFFRAAPAGVEGTGLGLAIGKAIAERHGLKLSITNRTDRSGLRVKVFPRGDSSAAARTVK
ncbi:ATP-binding protein [Lichenifustis flavocetrariae]|uniref:histidine kinase n=1 Tax=Lichenifustis flavocetrariae TaxID=2949735 RepID=A0AA42CS31_9HYPH|nr:ATP-binding protein [Lichenifustis flavocetrariae]MCW6513112.1 ATP-binding protein [Lichenifustis flavocetrariae]